MKKIRHYGFGSQCSQGIEAVMSFQVRPYYEGAEILQVLWVCPECGEYEFQDFKDYQRQKDLEIEPIDD